MLPHAPEASSDRSQPLSRVAQIVADINREARVSIDYRETTPSEWAEHALVATGFSILSGPFIYGIVARIPENPLMGIPMGGLGGFIAFVAHKVLSEGGKLTPVYDFIDSRSKMAARSHENLHTMLRDSRESRVLPYTLAKSKSHLRTVVKSRSIIEAICRVAERHKCIALLERSQKEKVTIIRLAKEARATYDELRQLSVPIKSRAGAAA
jgi:hypothetical protein